MDLKHPDHLNLLFPQWQGAGFDKRLYQGAKIISQHLNRFFFSEINLSATGELVRTNNILGYDEILCQLSDCIALLKKQSPRTILTIGGDCGVEPGPVTYLNRQYDNDLCLVWFDAHGDLNTPETSPSGHFHGMPLRTICGQGDERFIESCSSILNPGQVILAGAREFDPAEKKFINESGIEHITVSRLKKDPQCISKALENKGFQYAYVHIDLDVLDPSLYKNVGWPTPGGIDIDNLCSHLKIICNTVELAGMGIVEFIPSENSGLKEIDQIISTVVKSKGL